RRGLRTLFHHHQDGVWQELSWEEAGRRVGRLAAALVEAGVAPGERVLLMSENRLEWLLSDLAIMTAGAVTVPVYQSTPARAAQQIVDNSQARLAIVSGEALAGRLQIERVVRMDGELPDWMARPPGSSTVEQVEARAAAL